MKSVTKTEKYHLYSGHPSNGFPKYFARTVFDNCEAFQHRDFDEFFLTMSLDIQNTKRWEYVVTDESDKVIASMCFHKEWDVHVGTCLSVFVAFSTDTSALIGGYRWLFEIAKELDIPFVAYTREIKPFEYKLVYRKIK